MSFTSIFNNKPHCEHIDNHGTRCKGTPQKDKKFCFMHDPEQREKQAEARRKGGQRRFQPYEPKLPPSFVMKYKPPENHSEVGALLDQVSIYFVQGEMDLRSARFLVF